jgi:hypothetical protein
MASLTDLREYGEEIVPIIKDLFSKDADKQTTLTENKAVRDVFSKPQKLADEASKKTPAGIEEIAASITAIRHALTEILLQAASSSTPLPETQVTLIQAQRNALRNKFALLIEEDVFEPIAKLMTEKDRERIEKQIAKVDEEIADKRRAKVLLDASIKMTILLAKIAIAIV